MVLPRPPHSDKPPRTPSVQHDTTGHSDPQESGAEVEQIDLIKTVRWLEGGTGRSTSNVLPELSEQTSYAAAGAV